MDLPSLSVIVPNYNHAQHLPQCLDAMVTQSAQPQEILVIDDASTDDSVAIIERYAAKHPNIRLIRNERNQGVLPNINKGITLAASDYVYFAAADDFILPGFFEKSVRLLREHPHAGLCCTIGDWREPSTGLNPHIGASMGERPCFLSATDVAALERAGRLHIPSNTVIYRRDALEAVGGFVPELKWHTDWFAIYAIAFRLGICFVPEPLAVFILHPSGYSAEGPDKQRAREEVLQRLLGQWMKPEFSDVLPAVRDTGALFVFGHPMLKVAQSDPKYRQFLTPAFVRKARWHAFKMAMKKVTPSWLGEIYYRLSGGRVRKPKDD